MHLHDEGCVTHYYIELAEEKKVFSNMKAYVIVRGSVANIRNIVDYK